jgi:ankyrin repeat protein/HEAT repeat protein
MKCWFPAALVVLLLSAITPLGAEAPAPTALTANEEPQVAVDVHGSDAAEAFEMLQGQGIFVIPLGSLSSRSFIVPVELRFRKVPANVLVAGVARVHGLEVRWWKSAVTVAVLQRGAPQDEVQKTISDLGSPSAEVRTEAAWRSGWLEDAAVLPALVGRTSDADRWVTRQALRSVARFGWPAAVFFAPHESLALLNGTRNLGTVTGRLTWRMIAETCGPDALVLFKRAFDWSIPNAMAALGRVPGEEPVAILEKALMKPNAPELHMQAIIGLGLNGGQKATTLITRTLTNSETYADGLTTLARVLKERAMPTIGDALKQRRPAALTALGELGGEQALALCGRALSDPALDMRRNAVDAIGMIGGPGAPALLMQALSDTDGQVRVRAARALGRIGGAAALTALTAAYAEAAPEVRDQIVLSFAEVGGSEAVDLIASAAENPQKPPGIRADALGREAGDHALSKLRDLLVSPGESAPAADALGRLGDRRALGILMDGFSSTDPVVRLGIIKAAAQVGGSRTLPLLALGAKDADSLVLRGAVAALTQVGGSGAVDLLEPLRGNWEVGVRRAAAVSLGAIGGPASVNILGLMLADSEKLVRSDAVNALMAADLPQGVAPVGKLLGDPDLKWAAAGAIGKLGGPEAIALVYKLLDTSPQIAVQAARSFGDSEAASLWAKALTHRDPEIRKLAQTYVEGWTARAAMAASADPAVRAIAVPLLVPYADLSFAQDSFAPLLLDKVQDVQRLAVLALPRVKDPGGIRILEKALALDRNLTINAVRRLGTEETSALLAKACKAEDAAGLIRAVEAHDAAGVQALLDKGANVYARYAAADHNKAETILMEAAFRGYADLVTLLAQNGAGIETADGLGMTALSYAVLSANGTEAARRLLGLGARQQAAVVDSQGARSGMLAACARLGKPDVARLLVDFGADVNARGYDALSPLMHAALGGHADVASLLLEKGARIDDRTKAGETALLLAVTSGNIAVVNLLLDHGADGTAVDAQGKGTMARAIEAGRTEIVDMLAARAGQSGPTVLADALQAAGFSGKVDTIEALLARGIVPAWDAFDRADSMVRAAAAGRLDVIVVLQKQGMRIEATDAEETTPLAAAAEQGRTETVRYLLSKGALVNAKDSRGRTPLMRASAAGQAEVISLLLQSGADLYALDNEGKSALARAQAPKVAELLKQWRGPLIEAIRRGDLDAVKRIATPANVNVREPSWFAPDQPGKDTTGHSGDEEVGQTPLMFAAEAGNVEIARVLLQKGARIDDACIEGAGTSGQWTAHALDLAVIKGKADVVSYLLSKGVRATDDMLLNACINGYLEVVKVLAANGASVKVSVPESPYNEYDEGRSWAGDALSAAIEFRHPEIADFLRQKGAPLTPYALTAAIRADNPDLARSYLAAGSGANVSALVEASSRGYTDLVSAILGKGVDVDGTGSGGSTPLEAAALSGHVDVVRLLLEQGATVGKKDGRGQTVLELVEQRAGNSSPAIQRLLEETGLDPGSFKLKGDLTRAVLRKDAASVKKLLAGKPDPNVLRMNEDDESVGILNGTPMLIDVACVMESREIVQLFLQNGASVSSWSKGLRFAAGAGRADMVELLLSAPEERKGDSQGRLNTVLLIATETGNAGLSSLALSKGADANASIDRSALMNAVDNGSVDIAKALLARGADVNAVSNWFSPGTTALSLAMRAGRVEMVKLLLSHGADGKGWAENGLTPLTSLTGSGERELTASLLKNGVDVNKKDITGDTALHIAASMGDAALVQAIVAKGADLEVRDKEGNTALMRSASVAGSQEISLFLMRQGAKAVVPDPNGFTAIDALMAYGNWNNQIADALGAAYRAASLTDRSRDLTERFLLALMKRDLDAAAALLAQGAPVDWAGFDRRTPLMGVAAKGDAEAMKLLIDHGASPMREDKNGVNALDAAIRAGRNEAAALLLPLMPKSPDPRERMLRQAAFAGNADLARTLLGQGVNPDATNRDGVAALFYAAAMGHADIVSLLLDRNVMIERTGSTGSSDTAAVAACKEGHWDVVEMLLARGAKMSWLNALTRSPRNLRFEMTKRFLAHGGTADKETARGFLVLAAGAGDLQTVNLLLASGVTPDSTPWGGLTALGAALGHDWYTGYPEIALLLVEHGAPVNEDAFGGTVLMIAARKGYTEVVKVMLDRGANVNAMYSDGSTALRLAALQGHPLIMKMLIAKGARSPLQPPEMEYFIEPEK